MCDAKIRPFPDCREPFGTEIQCEDLTDPHVLHCGVVRDFAYPGSATEICWREEDRRTFRGEWEPCPFSVENQVTLPCILPVGHRGRCAA